MPRRPGSEKSRRQDGCQKSGRHNDADRADFAAEDDEEVVKLWFRSSKLVRLGYEF
jgi:hypothetical protein